MRTIILILALCLSATAQTYIFGGGKAAAIVGPQATILPASCVTEGLLLRLTADDGVNKRGLYYCVNGTYTRSGFTGTEGRLLRFGATNAVGQTTALYEDGSGNVGIGTTNSNARLSTGVSDFASISKPAWLLYDGRTYAQGGNGYFAGAYFDKPNTNDFGIITHHDGHIAFGRHNSANTLDGNNLDTWMRIINNGNVGIGTTAPTSKLSVVAATSGLTPTIYAASSDNTYIQINGPAANEAGLQFYKAGSTKWAEYVPPNSNDLRFWDGSTDRVTFQSGGNVGIGTTGPTRTLDIVGNTYASSHIESGGNIYAGGYFTTGDGSVGIGTGFGGFTARSTLGYLFSSTSLASGAADAGLARASAGVLEVNSGTARALRDLNVRTLSGGWRAETEGGCNTYSDLAVDGTLNTKVTSASYNFVAADVGSWLDITAGGAWTGGRYVITAVAANAATLASSPAAVSSTSGTFITGRGKIVFTEHATDDTMRQCRKVSSAYAWVAM